MKKNDNKPWLLVFSLIKWDSLFQRPQQIVANWSKDWNILFIEPITVGEFSSILPERAGNIWRVSLPSLPVHARNLAIRKASSLIGNVPILRAITDRFASFLLKKTLRDLGITKINGILLHHVQATPWLRSLPNTPVIFDLMDDLTAFHGIPAFFKDLIKDSARIAAKITLTSPELIRLVKGNEEKCRILSNGVDFLHFSSGSLDFPPEEVKLLAKPIILYAGTISYWLDFALLTKVASSFPYAQLVLCGPIAKDIQDKANALKLHSNVHFLGTIPYQELPKYLSMADVGLIPFLHNDLTEAVNPNKLYEYGAAKIPVVSVWLREISRVAPSLPLAKNYDEFIANIGACLSGDSKRFQTTEIAKQNSWSSVAEEMEKIFLTS